MTAPTNGSRTEIRVSGPDDFAPLFRLIEDRKPAVLALDGFCASGKTTLAAALSERYGARVIHTDDFYLPRDMRSDERYAEPGGTIHYERLKAEVIDRLTEPSLTCGVFSPEIMGIARTVTLPRAALTVIEGAYACHPVFGAYADLCCFMETGPEEQRRRILARNGPERLKLFESRWIPYELKYEAAFHIREKADVLIRT